jgi:hypothetical protein
MLPMGNLRVSSLLLTRLIKIAQSHHGNNECFFRTMRSTSPSPARRSDSHPSAAGQSVSAHALCRMLLVTGGGIINQSCNDSGGAPCQRPLPAANAPIPAPAGELPPMINASFSGRSNLQIPGNRIQGMLQARSTLAQTKSVAKNILAGALLFHSALGREPVLQ